MLKYYQAIGLACILAAVQVSCSTAKKNARGRYYRPGQSRHQ